VTKIAPQVNCVRQVDERVVIHRGGLVFKADRLFVSLNSRIESNKEEEKTTVWSALRASNTPFEGDTAKESNGGLPDSPSRSVGVWGLGLGFWGLGFGVWGWGLVFRV